MVLACGSTTTSTSPQRRPWRADRPAAAGGGARRHGRADRRPGQPTDSRIGQRLERQDDQLPQQAGRTLPTSAATRTTARSTTTSTARAAAGDAGLDLDHDVAGHGSDRPAGRPRRRAAGLEAAGGPETCVHSSERPKRSPDAQDATSTRTSTDAVGTRQSRNHAAVF